MLETKRRSSTFTCTIVTKVPVKKILFELEILLNDFIEKDEDLIEIRHVKEKKDTIIEPCPNCKKPDKNIKKMKDGSCGVCGGTKKITWYRVGKIVEA